MSVFDNIKDNILVNKISRKKRINIEELSKLSEEQIRKLITKKGIDLSHFNKIISSPELAINLVKLYKASKSEYNAVTYILQTSIDYEEILSLVVSSQDVLNISNKIYERMIERFLSDKNHRLDADIFPEEFKMQNNDVFLINILPEEIRNKYYNNEITEKDLFENIEIIHNLKYKDVIFKKTTIYKSNEVQEIISKLGIDNLYKIMKEYGTKFTDIIEDSQKVKKLYEFLANKEGNDYYIGIENCLYTDEELANDLGEALSQNEIKFLINANINKKEFVKYFNETFNNLNKDYICHKFIENISFTLTNSNKKFTSTFDLLDTAAIYTANSWRNSEDFFTPKFMNEHQQYFLPSGVKLNPATMYEDIKNNLSNLSNTNISAIFYRNSPSNYSGLFDNNCFLKLLELYNGNLRQLEIESNFYESLAYRCKVPYIHSYDEFMSLLKDYYNNNPIYAREIESLEKLNFDKQYIEEIKSNIEKYGYKKEDMGGVDLRLLSNNILQKFDSRIVKALITFYSSGASEKLMEYSKDEILSQKLNDWFTLLKNSDDSFLNFRNINHIILSFKECMPIIDECLKNNTLLDKTQMRNLLDIIINKNKYNVKNIDELTNYTTYKKSILKEKLESDNILEVKEAICESLFSLSLENVYYIINHYQINNNRLYKNKIEPNVPVDITASIRILKEIFNITDITKLKNIFSEAISIGNIGISGEEMQMALRNSYTNLWNNKMVKPNTNKTYYVNGVDSEKCRTNVNGQSISTSNKVKVIEFNGEPFNLIVHGIGRSAPSGNSLLSKITNDPSVWNAKEGITSISTSLITNTCIRTYQGENLNSKSVIYYGFNYLPDNVLRGASHCDAGTNYEGGRIEISSRLDNIPTPEGLISNTVSVNSTHNEVVLTRKSNDNNQKFDGRIQPTCIVVFNDTIDDAIKLSAQYFDIPIYKINLQKYKSINEQNKNMYISGQIEKFDYKDIETIFLTDLGNNNLNKVKLCIDLCNKALNEGLINEQQYYVLLQYTVDYIAENNIIVAREQEYLNEIQEILNNKNKENKDGITR